MIPIVKVAMPPKSALMPALETVLYSGMIAEGESVYQFEAEFNRRFGLKRSLAMSSGTGALHSALTLAGVGPGDEVISTPMTAEPTNTTILYTGAKVIWADVDPASGNMCPDSVRQCVTDKTKAILCVHYAGYPVRLAELRQIANERGIALIEDCAHALGASYQDQPIGTIGDYGIYSFQAIKHMTTVDGGMLTFQDDAQMEAAKKFRWFGMLKGVPRTEIDITSVGYKYNMSNVNATIGLVQLQNITPVLDRHTENGKYFDALFESISGVDFARCDASAEPSYWLYTLLSDDSASLEKALNGAGISASKLHRPNNLHSIFAASRRDLPGLDTFYKRLLHIPCGWWVSDEDRARIVEVIRKG
ncbi:dTDP-4-amino-4,6-dideoxygalactose transaminase [Cupriavidus sp. OV038]|jgi:dTDP-4-amino-4,6-dideoxygalactose transaminase|uniref:DegT/DnrJ/EryC1/StrS family aminotransferase n=1 Tax=unclassified Cupriavidus TaxID=2640874 RepID=UPI0008EE6DE5|nr:MULTISPECIES: DegT/DnrJ/EryC1/StrS family aminotransferase [unclassified Cupriavidus]SFB78611.1 dTDP-4-amino-4,6-dideoxygalactose transaminase [Cupriavidus sp. OV038]SFO65621.1 dTDP-4-amino-4,6-dideoxygalactose transaminase [Cupriavidus sp. OV096]